jgi:hypothetical protein
MLKDLKLAQETAADRRRDAAWRCCGAALRTIQRLGRGWRGFLWQYQYDPRQKRKLKSSLPHKGGIGVTLNE